jgi:hypothetical protein
MSDRNSTSFVEVRSDNYVARDAGYINLNPAVDMLRLRGTTRHYAQHQRFCGTPNW